MQVQRWISADGVGDLGRINAIFDAEKSEQIFNHHATSSERRQIGPKFILQQDLVPKHADSELRTFYSES